MYNDLQKRAPIDPVQMLTQNDPIIHRLASNTQTSTSRNYMRPIAMLRPEADLDQSNVESMRCRVVPPSRMSEDVLNAEHST